MGIKGEAVEDQVIILQVVSIQVVTKATKGTKVTRDTKEIKGIRDTKEIRDTRVTSRIRVTRARRVKIRIRQVRVIREDSTRVRIGHDFRAMNN